MTVMFIVAADYCFVIEPTVIWRLKDHAGLSSLKIH